MTNFKRFTTLAIGIVIGVLASSAVTLAAAGIVNPVPETPAATATAEKLIINGVDYMTRTPGRQYTGASPLAVAFMEFLLITGGYEVDWNEADKIITVDSIVKGIEEPIALRPFFGGLKESHGIGADFTPVDGGINITLTKGRNKLTVFIDLSDPENLPTTAPITFGKKTGSIDLVVKDGSSFVNEKNVMDAFKQIGFID
jgi:hypothetical protein